MATRTVFEDEENNLMEVYINTNGKLFIQVGQRGEDIAYNGYITLDLEDVQQLIMLLTNLEKEMPD